MTSVSRVAAPRTRPGLGHDRNHGLELLRATEASALAVGRWLGRGDKSGTRETGQQAMTEALSGMPFDGHIVLGPDEEGTLARGKRIGAGRERIALALVPVDGVSLVSRGLTQALSIAASAETDGIRTPPPVAYMHKISVGPAARGSIDISGTPEHKLRRSAFAMDTPFRELTPLMLARP